MEAELLYEYARVRQLELWYEAQHIARAAALRRGTTVATPPVFPRYSQPSPFLYNVEPPVDEPEVVTQPA